MFEVVDGVAHGNPGGALVLFVVGDACGGGGFGYAVGPKGIYDPDPGPDPVHNKLELVGAVPKLEQEICGFSFCFQGQGEVDLEPSLPKSFH